MREFAIFVSVLFGVFLFLWGVVGFIPFSWDLTLWSSGGRLFFVVCWLFIGIPASAGAVDNSVKKASKR